MVDSDPKHWFLGRFLLETFRLKTRRIGVMLDEAWVWGESSGWALRICLGRRRLILRRF